MNKYIKTREILLKIYEEVELSNDEKMNLYNTYLYNLRKLAYRGNKEAQYDLAQHYEDVNVLGDPNPNFNKSKRLYWYKKAAKNNNASAYNNLADLTERGDGCEKNIHLALKYYKKAMELGDPLGKENYTTILRDLQKGGIYFASVSE